MNAVRIGSIACALAFAWLSALAADSETSVPSNSSAPQDGVVTGSEKIKRDKGTPKALPTKKDKQAAIDAVTSASTEASENARPRFVTPQPEKNWDEMTPVEQDEARRRWLFSTGDFAGPNRGIKGGPVKSLPTAKDKGATGNSAQKGSAPNEQLPEK
jgi:hypothetical protein